LILSFSLATPGTLRLTPWQMLFIAESTTHIFLRWLTADSIGRINFLKMIETQKLNGEPLSPRIGYQERECLNELQKYAGNGRIDEGIFADFKQESIDELFSLLKEKNFTGMRKWCADNSDQDPNEIFRKIYDTETYKMELKSMPSFVVSLADYMYKTAFVADQEINLVAFLTEIMMETSFR
jgi:hypothetical protein